MKIFPEEVVNFNPQYFAPANASQWIDIDRFMHWMARQYQGLGHQQPSRSVTPAPMFSSPPVPPRQTARFISSQTPSSPVSSSVSTLTPKPIVTKRKRDVKQEPPSHVNLSTDDIVDLTLESDDEPVKKKAKAKSHSALSEIAAAPKPAGKGKGRAGENRIELTRQLKCDEVVELNEIPTCWTASRPDYTIAYLLDLTADEREWRDSKGELMSMAAIIKSQVSINCSIGFSSFS
jgi:hypothetical protein